MDPTVVAAVQLSSQADVAENLDRAAALVAEEDRRAIAEDLDAEGSVRVGGDPHTPGPAGPIARRVAEMARSNGVWVIGGGMPERSPDRDRPYNTCVVFSPEGVLSARYRKI